MDNYKEPVMSATALTLPAARSNSITRTLRIFLTEARYEFVRLLRTRAFSLAVIGFPVIFYLFFGLIMNRGEHIGSVTVAKYMLGSYAVFGMVGAALFGIGGGLASELSTGWLELKRASPMPPLAYLVAKCCSAAAFGLIIVSLLTLLGITIGHVSITLPEFARMMALTVIGTVPFACLGMVIALLVPFNAAPGVINIIYLPMSFCGGLWMPIMFLPHWLQKFALLLPTYHLSQLVLSCFGYATAGSAISHWLGLFGFTLVMLGVAAIAYRRLEQNS
jgi:ABC-2 type transport system permease protein